MRYFLHLAYNGKDYHGWQRQPGAVTVQEKIEDAICVLLKHPISVIGAGRTDAGVNASMMVAHFDSPEEITDPGRFIASLNGMADPFNISFYSLKKVPDDAHARFDAIKRTYRYYVHTQRSPFLFPFSLQVAEDIDFDQMNAAAEILLHTEDFTSFAKLHGQSKTNICDVMSAEWKKMPGEEFRYYFEISANRFLRNMVRSITGTLLEVGRGKLSIAEFGEIIKKKDRSSAGTSLPPSPLFLHSIEYPYWRADKLS